MLLALALLISVASADTLAWRTANESEFLWRKGRKQLNLTVTGQGSYLITWCWSQGGDYFPIVGKNEQRFTLTMPEGKGTKEQYRFYWARAIQVRRLDGDITVEYDWLDAIASPTNLRIKREEIR